jgi:hypothetical protein
VTKRYYDRSGRKRVAQRDVRVPPDEKWELLDDTRLVLYRLDKLFAAGEEGEADTVYIAEGEKNVHALEQAGALATCNPMGAGKWQDEYVGQLPVGMRRTVIVVDRDGPGVKHARTIADSVRRLLPAVEVELVQGKVETKGADASDHLDAGYGLEDFVPLEDDDSAPAPRPRTLAEVRRAFTENLYMPDERPLLAVLGAYAANRLEGEPVWLLLVGPSGDAKTELLMPLDGLPYVRLVGTLTGTPA